MKKLFSAKQIQAADQYTIENEPITSIDLMERAARQCVSWIVDYCKKEIKSRVTIFCGNGNNGGDGLAIARLLFEEGFEVNVYVLELGRKSADFKKNIVRLPIEPIHLPDKEEQTFQIDEEAIIVDAIFGTGLSRPVLGHAVSIIQQINQSSCPKISIDLPSGLFVEDNGENDKDAIVKADYTLSFQFPKLSFLFPENEDYIGKWKILNIGLSKDFILRNQSNYEMIELEDVNAILRPRKGFSHKGSFGHACILAGSEGKMGAAILAAKACLRSGVGLLSVRVPAIGQDILQMAVPEAMVSKEETHKELATNFELEKYAALGIGPGIGMKENTKAFVQNILKNTNKPLVIDADALNIISLEKKIIQEVPAGSILTPHPGEFRRLVGEWQNDYERLQLQIELATNYQLTVILKGKYTSIVTAEGKVYFNSTGNSGMATGGSGDVLTGILTALLAQGYTSIEASLLGVYLHGLAGDLAVKKFGKEAMIASDIIAFLGEAFKKIMNRK